MCQKLFSALSANVFNIGDLKLCVKRHITYFYKRIFLFLTTLCLCFYLNACLISSRRLQSLVEVGGFYLENDPCIVCNNPEIPFSVCSNIFSIAHKYEIIQLNFTSNCSVVAATYFMLSFQRYL